MAKKKRRGRKLPETTGAFLTAIRKYALAFFLFSMPIFFLPTVTEYGYSKVVYTLVWVSALLALWGVEGLGRRRLSLRPTPLWPLLPGFLAASLISLAGGTPWCVVIQSAVLILYFGLLYLLVANSVEGERELSLTLAALVGAGVVLGVHGLLQYLGLVLGGPGEGLNALISTLGNRNYLGGFLAYIFFPGLVLLLALRASWARALGLLGAGFVLAMALFVRQTGVRLALVGGWGLLALGAGFWQVLPVLKRDWPWWLGAGGVVAAALGATLGWTGLLLFLGLLILGGAAWALGYALRRWRWTWVLTLAVALLALFLLLPPTTPLAAVKEAWERNAGRVRAWDWWVGYEMWRDYPLTGVGLGGYKIYFVPYKPEFLASPQGQAYDFPIARAAQAHNEYVQVAAELGLVGVAVLLAGLGLLGVGAWRRLSAQGAPERRLELLLLSAGLATTFLHAGVSFPWHLPASSLAFVAILGCLFSRRYSLPQERTLLLTGGWLKAAVGMTVGIGLAISVIAVRDLVANGLLLAGQNALFLGRPNLAQAQLERAVKLDFCPRHSLYWLGLAQLQVGDLAGAEVTLSWAFARYRAEPVYMQLAAVEIELGNFGRARELLSELIASRPARDLELSARYLLAVIELREGDVPAALVALESLLEIAPNYPEALILLGDIARGELRFEDARAYYERALQALDRKIRRLERKLERPLTLKERGAVMDELGRLRRTRQKVQESLESLP